MKQSPAPRRRRQSTPLVVLGPGVSVWWCAGGSRRGGAPPDTRTRELRALTAAGKDHPRATRRLLALDRDARGPTRQDILPAYEWLLAAPDED